MVKKFPDWAPSILVSEFERLNSKPVPEEIEKILKSMVDGWITATETYDRLSVEELSELLSKLLSDSRMESVWKAIEKRIYAQNTFFHFYIEILSARMGPDNWGKLTNSEKEAWKTKVLRQISELNNSLKEHRSLNFDSYLEDHQLIHSGYYMIPRHLQLKILKQLEIDSDVLNGLLKSIDDSKDGITAEEQIAHITIDWNIDEEVMKRLTVNLEPLTTEEMLNVFSSRIMNINTKSRILKHPNSDNAHIVFFMRKLAEFNMTLLGSALYEVIANTTSVVFDIDISKERVADTIKSQKKEWENLRKE
jgi:hypothetical protein